eukprot:764704-Hanusia_phi.AAC.1
MIGDCQCCPLPAAAPLPPGPAARRCPLAGCAVPNRTVRPHPPSSRDPADTVQGLTTSGVPRALMGGTTSRSDDGGGAIDRGGWDDDRQKRLSGIGHARNGIQRDEGGRETGRGEG